MGWLDKLLGTAPKGKAGNRLPTLDVRNSGLPAEFWGEIKKQKGDLPNASLIYGIGAAGLCAFALYSLFTGAWFTAVLLLLPAAALFGFALHYLRYPS